MPKVSAPNASEASVAHLPSRHSCDYSFVEDFVPVKTHECSGSSLQSSTWLAISLPYISAGGSGLERVPNWTCDSGRH